ncbi:MAG: glycosyltransferase family 39 protein [Planctomycetota bacterium]
MRTRHGLRNPSARRFLVIAARILAVVHVVGAFWQYGLRPPEEKDAYDYDAVAWNLLHGRGYAFGETDPGFQEWYRDWAEQTGDPRYDERLADPRPIATTAVRPPTLPTMLAATYAITGRQVWPWRVISALLVAGAWWLAAGWAWRVGGPAAGWLVAGVGALEPFTLRYAGRFLTEPAILLIATALLASLSATARTPKRWPVLASGVLMGLSMVTRSVTGAWLPAACLAVYLGRRRGARASRKHAALAALACAAIACGTASPWWVRNVVVLGEPMPLGTQGGLAIAGGYSDDALKNTGKWVSPKDLPLIVAVEQEAQAAAEAGQPWTPLELEIARSKAGQAHMGRWAREHAGDMPRLIAMRLYSHWTDRSGLFGLILVVVAASAWRTPRGLGAVWWVVGLNTLAVMGTYAVGSGRFLVPLLPALAVLAACSTAYWLRKRRAGIRHKALANAASG